MYTAFLYDKKKKKDKASAIDEMEFQSTYNWLG